MALGREEINDKEMKENLLTYCLLGVTVRRGKFLLFRSILLKYFDGKKLGMKGIVRRWKNCKEILAGNDGAVRK